MRPIHLRPFRLLVIAFSAMLGTVTLNAADPDPSAAKEAPSALSGRMVDESGEPVTDAKLSLRAKRGREHIETLTDADGRYEIEAIEVGGDYRLEITSKRWVGITYHDQQIVHLTPGSHQTRDFTLPRACRLKVRTIDEQGQPIEGVRLMAKPLAAEIFITGETASTDEKGWATLGGLRPSDGKYIIATMHNDFGFRRLLVTLDDPDNVDAHVFVLKKGREIQGKAVCSDGKPPAGWRIVALPSWWHFGTYPSGQRIANDGSFTLPHILPGTYDVRISIEIGDGLTTPKQVLDDADLWNTDGPLSVTLDHPSPASMVYITGQVQIVGEPPSQAFHISADSTDGETFAQVSVRQGQRNFRIGPVPKGIYNIEARGVGLESKSLRVTAPAEDVELDVTSRGRPQLKGTVVDAESKRPVTDFRVRVTKLQALSASGYAEDANWREFSNEAGAFEFDVNGPGIYQVQVAAEGFAWTLSDPYNTVEDTGLPIDVSLTRGVSLSGLVVDEQGRPVDGATVLALSKATGAVRHMLGPFTTQDGAVETEQGRFVLPHLLPGKDTLKVSHPEYCFAIASDVVVGPERGDDPLQITLTRGATVRGHVYDDQGEPEPNITLYFQDRNGYGGSSYEEAGRFATAVTDADGFYEVRLLPEQLCYVRRAKEWDSLGVVRHCILPVNGLTHQLDLGGPSQLTGRLLINGSPFADGRVLVSGENPSFGIFKAFSQTDSSGSFTFHGIAPGNRTLYYAIPGRRNDWGRIQEVRVTADGADLGVIDLLTGQIVVRLEPPAANESPRTRVSLQEYDPRWPHGNRVGIIERQSLQDPFVIEEVPVGKYELVCHGDGPFHVRRVIEVTPNDLNQEVTVQMPQGTASLSGRIDNQIFSSGRPSTLRMWSKDGGLLGFLAPQEDGRYQLDNIPAGEYVIREKATRDAPVLLEVSLEDGEERTLDLTPQNVASRDAPIGYLEVRVYTPEGIPLPCDVTIAGSSGPQAPSSSQNGRIVFVEPPGSYTLAVDYPSFEPISRKVEVQPVGKEGGPLAASSLRIQLERASK